MQLNQEADDKFKRGDALTDEELENLYKFYKVAAEMANQLGPQFDLMWKELYARFRRLELYRKARKEKH